MHVDSLRLFQFRNFESLEVGFHPHLNLFLGANAQGKTNLLEALYCLSTTRSFRGAVDEELVRFEAPSAAAEADLRNDGALQKLRLEWTRGKHKTLWVDGKKQKKLSTLLGRLPAVIFSPDDLFLVKGGPGLRRRSLDLTALQIEGGYLAHLQHYERALKQRNALLRKGNASEDQLAAWEPLLAEHGAELMRRRRGIAGKLSGFAGKALEELTGGQERLELRYEPNVNEDGEGKDPREVLLEAWANGRREDRMRGVTLKGPHRDDLGLWVNGRPLRKFGSQGQQRTGALALKLAQWFLLKEALRLEPLVLFDDVMAELDGKRRAFFLDHLRKGGQAFLTGTSERDFAAAAGDARVFSVEAGKVRCERPGA